MTGLYEELKCCGISFVENGEELEKINNKCIMSPNKSASVRNALNIDLQAYDKFCGERLVSGKYSIYDTMHRINSLYFVRKIHRQHPKVN